MKHLLRKLHLGSNHADHLDSARASETRPASSGASRAIHSETSAGDQRLSVPSSLSGWLTSVGRQLPSINYNQGVNGGHLRSREGMSEAGLSGDTLDGSGSGGAAIIGTSAVGSFGEVANEMDFRSLEEEYQVQLAMAISASNNEQRLDPEVWEIEAVKRISLGLSPSSASAQAQVITYRYWTYNYLGYEDHVVDGFYDVYGITESTMTERMPTLSDLQALPVIDTITYEVVLVNRATDPDLVDLEQRALLLANDCGGSEVGYRSSDLVENLAHLVAGHMGGPVANDIDMLTVWRTTSWALKTSLHNIVLPLGRLSVGLARHRALLFKVLADRVGISCRLVKGRHYTGVDEGALNIVKGDDNREYIVDLVGDPGTLIPPDVSSGALACSEDGKLACGSSLLHSVDGIDGRSDSTSLDGFKNLVSPLGKRAEVGPILSCALPTSPSEPTLDISSVGLTSTLEMIEQGVLLGDLESGTRPYSQFNENNGFDALPILAHPHNFRQGCPGPYWRSPSATEGLASSGSQEVKDVSQNPLASVQKPQMAYKLHGMLLETVAVAPPERLLPDFPSAEGKIVAQDKQISGNEVCASNLSHSDDMQQALASEDCLHTASSNISNCSWSLDLLGEKELHMASPLCSPGPASVQQSVRLDVTAPSAAATTTSALMKPARLEAYEGCNLNIHVPIMAFSTVTVDAAAMTDTPCSYLMAVSRKGADGHRESRFAECTRKSRGMHRAGGQVADGREGEASLQDERTSTADHAYSHESILDDVAEWEIPWEDIVMGERIGLGSYGEVYRGDWHGSEVAVKKFLDQDLSGDALEEFRSEVRIMKRLRHPNVVLFMGAVTRAPNLSIVTEFLPRGSLYRLIHRPNNQLDERRRLRMALDVAKGMNYLHSCTPLIVHRDLKSPNLLVDKNWVVKVCDFGLSRMKHHTFLSSKSTAGTPEWMAPEVLRNEPSNEKSDVYSFGVILWELATLQQPWGGMNPMQVVGAVGFQHRRLDISDHMDPVIGKVIRECWQNDPNMRPSFSQLMNALKPLQRPILSSQPDNLRHSGSIVHKQAQQELVYRQPCGRRPSVRQDMKRVLQDHLLNNRSDSGKAAAFKDIQLAP